MTQWRGMLSSFHGASAVETYVCAAPRKPRWQGVKSAPRGQARCREIRGAATSRWRLPLADQRKPRSHETSTGTGRGDERRHGGSFCRSPQLNPRRHRPFLSESSSSRADRLGDLVNGHMNVVKEVVETPAVETVGHRPICLPPWRFGRVWSPFDGPVGPMLKKASHCRRCFHPRLVPPAGGSRRIRTTVR